jgi:FKBP-type peptidyl-prolyl cis-trans isomerase (trigger factor)
VSDHLGEFDTVAEWTESVRTRLSETKLNQARSMLIDRTTASLAELVDEEPPEALVTAELQSRIQNFVAQMQSQGIQIEQWLAATGQDAASFTEGMREGAVRAVKVDLALRAVAAAENLVSDDEDLEREYQRIAMRVNQKPNQVRKAYERNDAVVELTAQLRKSKALEWLLHRVEVVDQDGTPIDNDLLLGHGLDEHDHDHHHDEHDHHHDEHDHHHDEHDHDHDHEDTGEAAGAPTAADAEADAEEESA